MIYLGKARPATMTAIELPLLQFLEQYKPQKINVPTGKEEQSRLKTTMLDGFISGQMKELIRNNDNLESRDCLIIDLDDVLVSEAELKKRIHTIFYEVDYALYPSLRNGLVGVRYRLCVPLDRSVNEEENSLLVELANEKILNGIIGKPDGSNDTWSQLMLLPVITQINRLEDIIISKGPQQMPAQMFIDKARIWRSNKLKNKPNKKFTGQYNSNGQTFLGNFLDAMVNGVTEGDRDRWLTSRVGTFFKQGMNPENAYRLAVVINENFIEPPLTDKDVIRIFKSIMKTEIKRRGIQ